MKSKKRKVYRDEFGRFAKKPQVFGVKGVALFLILVLNWNLLGIIHDTIAYFNDQETSSASFMAGSLDFELNSPAEFNPGFLAPGETAMRTIEFVNLSNTPKYKIKAADFTGDLCEYLDIEANLKSGDIEFSGKLTDFVFGPVVYEAPEIWDFTLSLPNDAPETAQGQTCQFNFVFFGSQTKNNLEFGLGFNDEEQIGSNVGSKTCYSSETRSKGYWKTHPNVYFPHLPQTLGCSIVDGLDCLFGNETVGTQAKLLQILDTDYSLSMRNKLRGQLLAMKLNVAHFGVGDYFVAATSQTINEIIVEADDLLRQNPAPNNDALEAMKTLLESLVDLHIQVCSINGAPALEVPLSSKIVINEFL
ncbi:MAG: TasA family protein, partial [Candidatus Pacebacteria bacterium]|nr:TasA family protein [Candidatus Paceibacterota bacterium]